MLQFRKSWVIVRVDKALEFNQATKQLTKERFIYHFTILDEVDSQVRKLFGISTDDKTFLMNRFSRLDKTKRLVDLTLSENNEEECIRLEVGFESASASSAEAVNLRHSEE